MSPAIHMETERVYDAARQLTQVAEEIQQHSSQLVNQVMSINWQAPSREAFVVEFRELIQKMTATAENGILLADRIRREADEWLETDAASGSELSALATVLPAMNISKFFGNSWSDFTGYFVPPDLNEGMDYVLSTDAGRELIEEAKKNGLGFRLPDGRIVGDEEGKIIPIRFGDAGENNNGSYHPNPDENFDTQDQELVISEEWWKRRFTMTGRDGLGNTLAHEMQHALDDKKGLLGDPSYSGDLQDESAVEKHLETYFQKSVDTEVRAWTRGGAVEVDKSYQDDGKTSASEAKWILDKGYEATYEKNINQSGFGDKYTADVYLDESGNVRVDLKPKPELAPVFLPA